MDPPEENVTHIRIYGQLRQKLRLRVLWRFLWQMWAKHTREHTNRTMLDAMEADDDSAATTKLVRTSVLDVQPFSVIRDSAPCVWCGRAHAFLVCRRRGRRVSPPNHRHAFLVCVSASWIAACLATTLFVV